jgi:Domain of unknown function (DUF1127)
MLIGHFIRMLRTWQRYRVGVRELSRLGDIELADIGLTRSEINWIAWRRQQRARSRLRSCAAIDAPSGERRDARLLAAEPLAHSALRSSRRTSRLRFIPPSD